MPPYTRTSAALDKWVMDYRNMIGLRTHDWFDISRIFQPADRAAFEQRKREIRAELPEYQRRILAEIEEKLSHRMVSLARVQRMVRKVDPDADDISIPFSTQEQT
jgi:hypothetical protein